MSVFLSRAFAVALVATTSLTSNLWAADKTIVETAIQAGSFKTLVTAVQAADLAETLSGPGPFTVFAPTDEAFAGLPQGTLQSLLKPEAKGQLAGILTYHVVSGKVNADQVVGLTGAKTVNGQRLDISVQDGVVRIDGATVLTTDIQCSNGVIHVIDQVLLPADQTIPEVATAAGQFATLLTAASAADLVSVLAGEGPLTVFAPTDEAFGALPAGTIATLLKPENKQDLANILKYHVVAGRVYSEDALAVDSAPTVLGPALAITKSEAGAMINGARLLSTDIDASNGVIHVIDRVLLPPKSTESAAVAGTHAGLADAKVMISQAISEGYPVYNAGHHGRCAEIYMSALQSVTQLPAPAISEGMRSSIRSTMTRAGQMHSMTDRAWALRRQMDEILTSR